MMDDQYYLDYSEGQAIGAAIADRTVDPKEGAALFHSENPGRSIAILEGFRSGFGNRKRQIARGC
jgi:hypothetical protein